MTIYINLLNDKGISYKDNADLCKDNANVIFIQDEQ